MSTTPNATAPDGPLPALHQADLSWPTVEALFRDLAELCDIREVRLKGGLEARAGEPARDLAAARAAFVRGAAHGVQIRYVHAGTEWCDTLVRTHTAVRLVRIATPTPGGAP